jgi:CRAL/TRIO domain
VYSPLYLEAAVEFTGTLKNAHKFNKTNDSFVPSFRYMQRSPNTMTISPSNICEWNEAISFVKTEDATFINSKISRTTSMFSKEEPVMMKDTKNSLPGALPSLELCPTTMRMLQQLTEEEVEIAARTSHDYLGQSMAGDFTHRNQHAEKMCLRYLEAKHGNEAVALSKLKATLAFRKEMDMDGLRTAFQNTSSIYRERLEQQLLAKHLYVQSFDKEGRATYCFIPRLNHGHDAEWTLKESLFTMEKAIAASEYNTKGMDSTINAVVDFNGFLVKHAPPLDVGKQFLLTLRNHYVGQVNKIYLVDAPTSFQWLWALLKNFVGQNTVSKIKFVSSTHGDLEDLYSLEEAQPWMVEGGRNSRELNVKEYLYDLHFSRAYHS